ncbi:hypothetical protein NDU88_001280 [Pleurodeles waltl]|uniref:Uncharacterized protein n=1 Tax=Pleurodeles waltl TaxID=8319 RepID=A0AAV7L945_PLEWA|nr:hypothetical protein NDU88_001280 [Pleurodeles waltl]
MFLKLTSKTGLLFRGSRRKEEADGSWRRWEESRGLRRAHEFRRSSSQLKVSGPAGAGGQGPGEKLSEKPSDHAALN